MNWYIAKIVYQIICGDGQHTPQFDEQLRLIHANSQLQAFRKARNIGMHEDDCFLNDVNKPVHWKFIDVAEIVLIDEVTDGAEIYSKISEEKDAEDYIRTIHLRAATLCETSSAEFLALN
jgi:hypothetical protein